jgi:hypothetical protein
MNHVYLTRRNLLTLLSKLDRQAAGETTACTIIKHDTVHPTYPTTEPTIVTALEDEEYYADRGPGDVHFADHPALERS